MCTENFVKDRHCSDMVESLNIAIGANTELKMLLGGVTSASALFATLFTARTKLLEDHYDSVASLMR